MRTVPLRALDMDDNRLRAEQELRRPELRKHKTMKAIDELVTTTPETRGSHRAAIAQRMRDYAMATSILEARAPHRGDVARQKATISFEHQQIEMNKVFRTAPGGRAKIVLDENEESVRRMLRSASTSRSRNSVAVVENTSPRMTRTDSGKKKKKSVSFQDETDSSGASLSSASRQHHMDHARCNDDELGPGNGHVGSPIHAACYKGDHVAVTHMLSFYHGQDAVKLANSMCSCGMSPLQVASDLGHAKVAKVLLKYQARVGPRRSNIGSSSVVAASPNIGIGKKRHRSCIALAAARGSPETIEVLLEHGAAVDEDALVTASSLGDAAIVRALMQTPKKKPLDKLFGSSSATPTEIQPAWISNAVSIAVVNSHAAVVSVLLGDGQSSASRERIVHCALEATSQADYKLLRCLTKLYDHALMVSARDSHQNSLLHLAVKQASVKCVTLLVRLGVDVNARDALGITPLYMACARGQTSIVKLLVNAGALCERMGPNDETPLHIAAQENHVSCVQLLLLEAHAQVDDITLDRCTALHLACQRGNTTVAKCLLDHGADVNARTVCDETPLLKASRMSNMETVKLLLARNAEIATSSTSSISSCSTGADNTTFTHTASTASSVVSITASELESEASFSTASSTGRRRLNHEPSPSRETTRQRHSPENDSIFLAKSSTHTSLRGWLKSVIKNK